MLESTPTATVCGQLLVGGFPSPTLSATFARALAAGERAGAILFKRNLGGDLGDVAALTGEIARTAPADLPPLIGVDQEGGRVVRIGPPALALPAMRRLAATGDVTLATRVARAQAQELRALGFTMSFAPVLDVNTCAANPIIGDRAFGEDPGTVARFGVAFARGLAEGGISACGKHFPGHGDTSKDSHLDLPTVARDRAHLDAVELPPFAAGIAAGIPALMSAHVLYPALDPDRPATLSRAICTDLLRGALGFTGVLISDDLEMKAVADRFTIEDAACEAVAAGCDLLLVCADEALQARAHAGLVRRAEREPAFRARCVQAAERGLAMRRRVRPEPILDRARLAERVGGEESRRAADELSRALGGTT